MPIGTVLTLTGWGQTTNILKNLSARIIDQEEFTQNAKDILNSDDYAQEFYQQNKRCPTFTDIMGSIKHYDTLINQASDRKVFALNLADKATSGDSGGGAVYEEFGKRNRLIGAIQIGGIFEITTNIPMSVTLLERVSYYVDWIQLETGIRPLT